MPTQTFSLESPKLLLQARTRDIHSRFHATNCRDTQKSKGQFFTPPSVASFMAQLLPASGEHIRLLDPGAGLGALSVAFCEQLLRLRKNRHVEIHAFETDGLALPLLEENLQYCKQQLQNSGHELEFHIHDEDFILSLASEYFESDNGFPPHKPMLGYFDAVITNPPYFKLNKESDHAKAMSHVIHGQPNIYALFLAMAAQMLAPSGSLVAITPRSFCNGLYFREFRRWMLSHTYLRQMHLFRSRTDTFRDSKVLQESVISWFQRCQKPPSKVSISSSNGQCFSDLEKHEQPYSTVIDDISGDNVVFLPESDDDASILRFTQKWKTTFSDIGLKISTGPVVLFRTRPFLQDTVASKGTVPLLSSHNVQQFETHYPVEKKKWSLSFTSSVESQKHLVRNQNYVLLKRFSSKEEKRRLTAGCLLKEFFNFDQLAIENHLNYIYHQNRELSCDETFGIAAVFNSVLFDRYFRIFSGNTQVNATEIRSMCFPSLSAVAEIGGKIRRMKQHSPQSVENAVLDALDINGKLRTFLLGTFL